MYNNIRAFVNIGGRVYGPFFPTLTVGSDRSMPSCHAEVNAIKHIYKLSKGKQPKMNKVKLYIVRWSWSREQGKWILQRCYPCSDCAKYLEKHKITKIYISTDNIDSPFEKVTMEDIKKNTRPSTGRLYGK